jgi:hypothetical protein
MCDTSHGYDVYLLSGGSVPWAMEIKCNPKARRDGRRIVLGRQMVSAPEPMTICASVALLASDISSSLLLCSDW